MKTRRAFFFGGPVGASILIALIPGPCTTFDDVTPPGVDAASELDSEPIVDGAPYDAQCGLVVIFGDGSSDRDCQQRLDRGNGGIGGCCRQEATCADSGGCASWVACVNEKCPPGGGETEECKSACPKPDASLIEQQITAVSNCGVSIFGDAGCLWP